MMNDWDKRIRHARSLIARGRFQRFVTKDISTYEKAPVTDNIRIEEMTYSPYVDDETGAIVYIAEAGKNRQRSHIVLTFPTRDVEEASTTYEWYDKDS